MGIFKRMKDVWDQIFNPTPIIDFENIRHHFMAEPITSEEFLIPDKENIEAKTREFLKLGFSHLGDFEYRHHISVLTEMTVLIRIFIDEAGITMAEIVQVCPHPEKNKSLFCTQSFSNELSDGTFFGTTNAPVYELIDEVDGSTLQNLPPELSLSELWDRHRFELEILLSTKNVQPISFQDLDEILESEERAYSLFREEVRKRGNFTTEEMMKYCPETMIAVRPTHYSTYKNRQGEQLDDYDDDDD